MRPERIVLTGFMASGKSSVGRELARLLGYGFVDTDEIIARREGRAIADIWLERGESYFREREAEVAAEVAQLSSCVIATGGGLMLSEANRALLADDETVVCLHADTDVLLRRLREQRERPLMFTEDIAARIDELLAERDSVYISFEHHIDTTETTPREAALEIAGKLGIEVSITEIGAQSCPVVIRAGLMGDSRAWDEYLAGVSRVFVISNEVVFPLHGAQLLASIAGAGREIEVITVPDGEKFKTLDSASRLIDELAQRGADRSALVLAFGGGVIGDLAGFTASIYMRGLPLIQLPTTLLAQVDAAIGAKTAVDHAAAKNLAGSFHQPRFVLSDPALLRTLPRAELSNGLAEVIKTGLIGSRALFERVEQNAAAALDCDVELLETLVRECRRIKSAIVSADPYDTGERRLLNLGHTLGHALEAAGGYSTLSHGQAVGLGMLAAASIGERLGVTPQGLRGRVAAVLQACELPTVTQIADSELVLDRVRLDKKVMAGQLSMVLPAEIGEALVSTQVTTELLRSALEELRA